MRQCLVLGYSCIVNMCGLETPQTHTAAMDQPSNEHRPSGATNGNGQQQQQIHLDQNGKLRKTLIWVKCNVSVCIFRNVFRIFMV